MLPAPLATAVPPAPRAPPALRWVHPAASSVARVLRSDAIAVVAVELENFELRDGASVCVELATASGTALSDDCFTEPTNRTSSEHCPLFFEALQMRTKLQRGEYVCTARLVLRNDSVVARTATRVLLVPPLDDCPPSRDAAERYLLDAFPVFDELDVLELRFREASGLVDRFLVVESELTFAGKPKPLYFGDALAAGRFAAWRNRITHLVVSAADMRDAQASCPDEGKGCYDAFEQTQRDRITLAARAVIPADRWDSARVLLSDADEIPRSSTLRMLRECDVEDSELLPLGLQMRAHHYSFNFVARGMVVGESGGWQLAYSRGRWS